LTGRWGVAAVVFGLLLAGCATTRVTSPPRSATEQLLISAATDAAARRLDLDVPVGTSVFVEAAHLDAPDARYAVASIRDRFLRKGLRLVDDKAEADVVAEIRIGAQSIDDRESLVGFPGSRIPVPFASESLTLPEIVLFKTEERVGVAKLAVTGRDARSGRLAAAVAPVHGYAHRTRRVMLLFFSWTTDDLVPDHERDRGGRLLPPIDLGSGVPSTRPSSPGERPGQPDR
jgi:hypothetical protein